MLGLLFLWLIATLGLRPLLVPDEERYAEVAREMLLGDPLIPTLNGLPFFHKPPLFYWIDMAAMQALGVNAFSARMGSALGAWLMGASLYLGLRRWHGAQVARIGLGVLATSPFYYIAAQYANHDMLVAGLITIAVMTLLRALDEPPHVHRGWLAAAAVACALAVLAKGLIGIVLPGLVVLPWLLVQRRWRQLAGLFHPVGLLTFALVALPWFGYVQARYPGFFDYFFVEQHFRRYAQTSFNNVNPFWFFLAVLPAFTLPWSIWLPQAVKRHWDAADGHARFHVWWVVAVVGFFSFPSSKLVGYVLPAIAPWCALIALAMVQSTPRLRRWMLGASAALCVAIVVALTIWQEPRSSQAISAALAKRIAPEDRVVMVDAYYSNIAFLAGLAKPAIVASDWANPEIPHRDNWRKELHDAAKFDIGKGQELLRLLAPPDRLFCGAGTVWVVSALGREKGILNPDRAELVFQDKRLGLWRMPTHPCGQP